MTPYPIFSCSDFFLHFSNVQNFPESYFKSRFEISPSAGQFLAQAGFLHLRGFLSPTQVEDLKKELQQVEKKLSQNQIKFSNQLPIYYQKETEKIERLPFANLQSEPLQTFFEAPIFDSFVQLFEKKFTNKAKEKQDLKAILGLQARDGLVFSQYQNLEKNAHKKTFRQKNFAQMGWHIDNLRDLFLFKSPQPMLNLGLHLDDTPKEKGGLRILPASHQKNTFEHLFFKWHFFDKKPEIEEIAIETQAGDLTLHLGNLWHRVAPSEGAAHLRRVLYVPILFAPSYFLPSKTKFFTRANQKQQKQKYLYRLYHHLFEAVK
ncbi:phytanoyl-CoA dioxygenase family protein [Hugenholtzia roseola]|uniref:phytanoyl-CoA dioxygenase family protein n=1 Tax=Hugenholtzia roseola TaxID=1002 RepID=UPI000425FD7B|nr:phytanoyl-CoA dioxygenase family protein [Hugenholtzia roseola]